MRTYGLIGYPLGHSFSESYFTEKFQSQNINACYKLFPIANVEMLQEVINSNPSLKGFNVTIPYKQQVMSFLNEIDDEAAKVGAVNVVKVINREGKKLLKGYNSDIYGFYTSLQPLLQTYHDKALILGTGGASKAVSAMLTKLGIDYKFVSRKSQTGQLTYDDIDSVVLSEHKLIVNCTPVGMSPNTDEAPSLPYEFFTEKHIAYDLIYNPSETLFLSKAKEHGATIKNGLEMLHLQAERAWEIWNKHEHNE